MTRDEFERWAGIWGGDLARWPTEVYGDAMDFVHRHPDAAAILARAGELDDFIAGIAPTVTETRANSAAHAVVTHLAAASSRPVRSTLLRPWLMPAVSFACAAALGIYLGFAYPLNEPTGGSIAGQALVMILDDNAMLTWIH